MRVLTLVAVLWLTGCTVPFLRNCQSVVIDREGLSYDIIARDCRLPDLGGLLHH